MLAALMMIAAPTASPADASPWDGSWTLDASRSSPGAGEQAAAGYRFGVSKRGAISWEIPSLKEVVLGKTDGTPMVIRRAGKDSGTRLSVRAEGAATLSYRVSQGGRVVGGGRMTLVDAGKAWVDITWGPKGPPYAAELIYVRDPKGA
jgi:hypothetical protein